MVRFVRLRSYAVRPALAPALVTLLLATSCGGVRPASTATLAPEEATRMFAAGYSNIDEMYIDKVDFRTLAVAGLSNLTKLDPGLTIHQTGGHVDIAVSGHPAGGFDSPSTQSVEDWASVTAGAINLARTASPELSGDNPEDVYKAVFEGMLGKLDRFSRYSTPDSAREHRAAREGFGGIGVRVAIETEGVRVSSVMADAPGGRAGLKQNDLITHIDGESVIGRELQAIIQLIRDGFFSRGNTSQFQPLIDNLMYHDPYFVFADYQSYADCQALVDQTYRDKEGWTRMSILNSARSGKFSSDRTIREYCDEIWKAKAVPVQLLSQEEVKGGLLQ